MSLNPNTLVSIHGYAGDRKQIDILMDLYTHHECPIVIMSPSDSPIKSVGPHICWHGKGLRAYTGQLSWDRQWEQMKQLLTYPFDWFFCNDSDSCSLEAKFPEYLYEDENTVYSNEVEDFRKPGESWQGLPPWPLDYHAPPFELIAMQPPYFMHRKAMQKLVDVGPGIACPITPFIDWQLPYLCTLGGVNHKPFRNCASCETETPNGIAVMSQCVLRGSIFVHAIKTQKAKDIIVSLHKQRNKNK